MATVKTYSIQSSVDAKVVNAEKLRLEIASSGSVVGFSGLCVTGDVLDVYGVVVDNYSNLNATVKNHVPVSLDEMKAAKVDAIDIKTQSIIAQGFAFDGHRFSLSLPAQTNWLGLMALRDLMPWPVGCTDEHDETYLLSLANLPYFVGTASMNIKNAIDSGRALKMQANAASTKEELDAVVDDR